MQIKISGIDELEGVADRMLAEYGDERIFIFRAAMGAGKTTFIKELCSKLNVVDIASSPTFAIVNVYLRDNKEEVNHFDLYRLNKPQEVLDIGFYEYIESGNYCFIEWPDLIIDFLPDRYVEVVIEEGQNTNSRVFKFSKVQ